MINIYEPVTPLQFVSRETFIQAVKSGAVADGSFLISINDNRVDADEIVTVCDEYAPTVTVASFVFPDEEIGIPRETAESIIAFAEYARKINAPIVVHCLMGISRSGAVAKFINEYFGLDVWFINSYLQYNRSIYNSLCTAAGTSLVAMYEEMERAERSYEYDKE